MKTATLAAVLAFALGACATTEQPKSYTPKVQVVVRAPKAKAAQANYQAAPAESKLTGSGGSAK